MTTKWLSALVAGVVGAAAFAGGASATPAAGLTTTILAKSPIDRIHVRVHSGPPANWRIKLKTHGVSDGYVVDNKLAPGGTTGWHSHPGPSLIFVVAGTVTNYEGNDPTCTGQDYTAGQAFVDEGGGDVHMLKNRGTVAAETIAVQLVPTGADRRIDMPAPNNKCNP
jgi:quercetin dioxygenase-like cupin family protein